MVPGIPVRGQLGPGATLMYYSSWKPTTLSGTFTPTEPAGMSVPFNQTS